MRREMAREQPLTADESVTMLPDRAGAERASTAGTANRHYRNHLRVRVRVRGEVSAETLPQVIDIGAGIDRRPEDLEYGVVGRRPLLDLAPAAVTAPCDRQVQRLTLRPKAGVAERCRAPGTSRITPPSSR
jgi:hypothetical protein